MKLSLPGIFPPSSGPAPACSGQGQNPTTAAAAADPNLQEKSRTKAQWLQLPSLLFLAGAISQICSTFPPPSARPCVHVKIFPFFPSFFTCGRRPTGHVMMAVVVVVVVVVGGGGGGEQLLYMGPP